ncbi:MAG TPA: chloride channel protein [Stellaceae bacterium]|nr:chloride channel protein [Stellaceae bacterium]
MMRFRVPRLLSIPRPSLRRRLWLSPRLWRRRIVFWLGAIAVGIVSVGFARASEEAQAVFGLALGVSPLLPLVLTPLGFATCAIVSARFFPGAQGSGIPQVIAARHLHEPAARLSLLSMRLATGKILLTLVGLSCGAAIGREGPTVQVGAALMLFAARTGRMGQERGVILAGGAAGVAAAFNTPLAGIVFAIEELSRSFEQRTNGVVLTTVIIAGLAALSLAGDYTYFGQSTASLGGPENWLIVPLCGIVGGLFGGIFSRAVIEIGRLMRRLIGGRPWRIAGFAAGCGLALAILGLATGGLVYGTGYTEARAILEGGALPWGYAPAKLVAVLLSTLSGIPGGIFAPALSVGAGLGNVLAQSMPDQPAGAVVLLAMVGYFAGVVQAPITAAVIVFEMTAGRAMTIPILATALIGHGASKLICPHPLYHTLSMNFLGAGEAGRAGKVGARRETVR